MPRRTAEEGLIGFVLGRMGDSPEKARDDYLHMIAAVGGRRVDAGSFSVPGLGVVFDAATAQRAATDGLPADIPIVFSKLAAQARAEGLPTADGTAFGIGPMRHLKAWSEAAPSSANVDYYAWTVAKYAYGQAFAEALATAEGMRAQGANPATAAAWLTQRLAELDADAIEGGGPDGGGVSVTAASEIRMRAPKWLYDLRIPAGGISLLAGREGIGKSSITYDIIARLTKGTLAGRYFGIPRSVGIVATEDAWEEVIVPRLVAAGADRSRVFRFNPRVTASKVVVPDDLPGVARLCRRHDIALIVLDPILSVVDGRTDTHKNAETRAKALDPLAAFARESQIAVLALIHVNKSGRSDPLEAITGSKAFVEVARSVLFCIADPAADEEGYLFCHPKSSYGPKQPSVSYRIQEVKVELDPADVEPGDDTVIRTTRIVWGEEDERSAQDVMEASRDRPTGDLVAGILAFMKDQPGAVELKDVAAEFPDVAPGTLRQNMHRMVNRGQLSNPSRGVYEINPESNVTPMRRP